MLIDVNTYIGHWPFRQLRHNTASALVRRMDRYDIDQAVVASINGIFYKNVHPANEEIAHQTRTFRDRLLPFGTINPMYAGWEEDLRRCAEDLELQGLRLFPQYHGYRLTDPVALELIDAASERNWAIQVPMRVVDRRQRHPWDIAEDIPATDFEEVIALRPKARWMILDALGMNAKNLPKKARYVVEISRMTAVLQRNIQGFIEDAGPGHLAFGTGMPFKVPDPTLLKLQVLDAPARVRNAIASGNVTKMLA